MVRESHKDRLDFQIVTSPAFREIWENSLLGVMVIDNEGLVVYVNSILAQTDDLLSTELSVIGQKMIDLYPVERERHQSIQVLDTGISVHKKPIVYYTVNKKLVSSLCSAFPLYTGDQLSGVIYLTLNMQASNVLTDQYLKSKLTQTTTSKSEKTIYTFESLIGNEKKFVSIVDSARSASETDFNILIFAESGCGKEILSHAIHNSSTRKNKPFVPINCSAIPENLLEATLFGTARGAFTGAVERAGLLEEASGGTLLLDELNSMPLALQAKLLRAVQEKKIRRVGANKEISVDVRFVSTCNISPEKALKNSHIREDLFFRLAVIVLEIPPLRERKSDIFLLADHFLGKVKEQTKNDRLEISNEVYRMFVNYCWPGNVRELEHAINASSSMLRGDRVIEKRHLSPYFINNYERFTSINCTGSSVKPSDLTGDFVSMEKDALSEVAAIELGSVKVSLKDKLDEVEKMYIEKALVRSGYNVSKAGRILNLTPQALRYKIGKLKIEMKNE